MLQLIERRTIDYRLSHLVTFAQYTTGPLYGLEGADLPLWGRHGETPFQHTTLYPSHRSGGEGAPDVAVAAGGE